MMKLFRHPFGHLLLLLVLGTLAYANSFQVPFELDDLESITQNPTIRALGNFLPGGPGYDFQPRRWVGYFTFALNYRFGELDVSGYHRFNLAVHLGTALLVYALVRLTFRTPNLTGSRLTPQAGTAALLAALFFAVHPVQTQAVTYIAQRLTCLATFFYVLALVLYAAARLRQEQPDGSGAAGGAWKVPLLLFGSVSAALLAMQTKEIAFTLPIAAALYEICFFRGEWRRRSLWLLPLLLTLPVVPFGVLAANGDPVTPGAAGVGHADAAQLAVPRLHYLFTQLRVLVTYLRLLILPVGQNVDYEYPIYTTFFSAPVVSSFLLLAAVFALAVVLYRRSARPSVGPPSLTNDPALRLTSFGIFWFFLALSVESSLVPLADVIAEHRLYLPSVGLAVAAAVGVLLTARRSPRGRLPLIAAALAIGALTLATYQRNQVWGDNVRLWEDVARKSPGKGRPWYNLGTYLTDGGKPDAAIPALSKALAIDPQNAHAWHNLGRAYLMLGRPPEAVRALGEAVRLAPDMDNAVVNLSAALLDANRPAEAVPLLERIRQRYPTWAEPCLNLGLAYLGVGDLTAARRELAFLQRLASPLATTLEDLLRRASAAPVGK